MLSQATWGRPALPRRWESRIQVEKVEKEPMPPPATIARASPCRVVPATMPRASEAERLTARIPIGNGPRARREISKSIRKRAPAAMPAEQADRDPGGDAHAAARRGRCRASIAIPSRTKR